MTLHLRAVFATSSLAILALAAPAFAAATVHVATAVGGLPHVITVSGHGEVNEAPDQASLSAGVVTQDDTAAEALSENAKAMAKAFAALKDAGVPDKDIRTSNLSVEPQYPPYNANNANERRIIGYQVSDELDITLAHIDSVGPVIDALVHAGVNQMNAVSFSIHDSKALMNHARQLAVADAIDQAQTLAKAAHVRLGPIVSIDQGGAEPRPIYPMRLQLAAAMMPAAPTPIATGQETISADVSITWVIR
jgi:uncharacterized protein YggE